jgi:nucleotide-binding universal stress UspA family protein
MPSIVVAVDFSNSSIHAIEYAIPLSNKLKADIILAWVDKIAPTESIYPDTSAESRNEAKKRFEELIRSYTKRMGKDLKIEYKLKKGKVYYEIDNLARNADACFIITGTHGISGFEEYWIGSNAFKIVTYASRPVITVRHDFPVRKGIDKILVPIDSSAETLQKLPQVVKLARLFKSEVNLIATHSSHLKSIQRITEKYMQQASSYLFANEVKYFEDSIVSNDGTKSVLTYAEDIGADLIAIMTEQETPANVLIGPQAQQLVSQSPIPVLSLHPAENFNLK